jgi:glycosyltransferase involved in cell wall biosynthesis
METPDISIIIPIYNEASNLKALLEDIFKVMRDYGRTFEVIAVDDGSTDESVEILKALKKRMTELKSVVFRKNFGQSAAMTAGFDHAEGEIIVSLDGDGQNDPRDIPMLISRLEEGFDLVNGWRKERKDKFISRRLPSIVANRIIGAATGVKLHDYGCSLKAYKKEIAKNLLLYGELHRFIPVLSALNGAKIGEVVVRHHERKGGKSKYGIGRTYRVILDLLLMLFFQKFATRPLQFFGLSGGVLFSAGFFIELYLTWLKLFQGKDIGTRPLLLLGALLIISGIMLGGIGLLAELVMRTYFESQDKRIYSIREVIE